jgi:hypothetical protein
MATTELNPIDVAWFAGLFEGEGCIHRPNSTVCHISIRMTDRDIVERAEALFPMPNGIRCYKQNGGLGTKPLYEWNIARHAEVVRILGLILPYLGTRRTGRALALMEYIANRPGQGSFERNKTHCPKGHEYTPENTYRSPCGRGGRMCRICIQDRNRRKSSERSEALRRAKLSG